MKKVNKIDSTEFENNVGLYLMKATKEDYIIYYHGKPLVRLTDATDRSESFFHKYRGIVKEEDIDYDDPRIRHMVGLDDDEAR